MNVLFVDDHVACADMFADIAEGLGHRACVAHDCVSALRRCSEETFDLILMDIGLPDGTATTFAANFAAVRARKKLASWL
jgi:CheY-like chemotaxis protein